MAYISYVKLEFLRPGPAHNQLLSPLTPYIALCSGEGPTTLYMPFEQRHLLNRLERLRYVAGGKEISRQQRESEVHELGEILGALLSKVPALISSLGSARREKKQLVHLRLVAKAYELSLLPFELSIAADGFPCSGSPLFLQSNEPITLTREVRGRHPIPVNWDRPPRILFAFAAPGNLPAVPYQAHLKALRRAIEPWVKFQEDPELRIKEVKKMLTVLPNATLQDISNACDSAEYTYIHILAHGDTFEQQGNTNYGLALCNEQDSSQKNVIDGATLAFALTAKDSLDSSQASPTLVSLATCDSGNTGTTIIPGGSIAHALHAAGIPWIVASQFPLWMNASSIATQTLYEGILSGEDPRWVLYNLRLKLRIECKDTHDWASIVAYASVPWNFEDQIEAFRNKQNRRKIEIWFAKAENNLEPAAENSANDHQQSVNFAEFNEIYSKIRNELQQWQNKLPKYAANKDKAELLNMTAASEKRIGNMLFLQHKIEQAYLAYKTAGDFYKQAFNLELTNHWALTQYLSIRAVLAKTVNEDECLIQDLYSSWAAAKQITLWQYSHASNEDRAWALGTLAELELLGAIYNCKEYNRTKAKKEIKRYCKELKDTAGTKAFPVFSTHRQLLRYQDFWSDNLNRKEWAILAKTAIDVFGDIDDSWHGKAYLKKNKDN